jgi:Peptidase M50B-like
VSKKKKSKNKYTEFSVVISLVLVSLLLWETPVTYPVKLFIVLIHEINHAIMTIVTGGSVKSIRFAFDLSGLTITNGGNLILIAIAGYLGSLLIGTLLYLSAENLRLRKWLTSGLAIIFFIVAVNLIEGGIQIFLTLLVALVFYFAPKYLSERIISFFLKFLGLISCLYVIVDIKQDLLTTTLRETDTQILEYITGFPAILIGLVVFFISIFIVFLLIRKSYFS